MGVLFLKFTEVPTTEFQLFSTNPELQIWQPCKNQGCHVKTDFVFGFYIKKWTRINGFRHLSVFLNMKKIKKQKKKNLILNRQYVFRFSISFIVFFSQNAK